MTMQHMATATRRKGLMLNPRWIHNGAGVFVTRRRWQQDNTGCYCRYRAHCVSSFSSSSKHPPQTADEKNHDAKTHLLPPDVAGRKSYELRQRWIHVEEERHQDSRSNDSCSMSTLLAHAGLSSFSAKPPKNINSNEPLSPSINLATTYERPASGNYNDGGDGNIYARTHNPTRQLLESTMGQMEILLPKKKDLKGNYLHFPSSSSFSFVKEEKFDSIAAGAPVSAAFSSGMAAATSLILAHPSPLIVILPDDVYHGTPTAFINVLHQHGIRYVSIDMTNIDNIHDQIVELTDKEKHNVVVWMETPSNPLCKVVDIYAICEMVNDVRQKEQGHVKTSITTVVDSTWAPPCITQPLLLGSDAVLHSGTKYLGGHSDVLLGVVTCSPYTSTGRSLGHQLKIVQSNLGAVASPFDSWLTLRGLRTLHVRLRQQCQNAMELATFLSSHPVVAKVHYPGLKSHPQHDLAAKQMHNGMFGGMLSFEVQNASMAMAVAGAVRTVRRATSLGGTETLIEHRASIEPKDRVTSPEGLLRVSVGLEDSEDLKEDLDAALKAAKEIMSTGQC